MHFGLPRPPADHRLAGDEGDSHQMALLAAARRRHGAQSDRNEWLEGWLEGRFDDRVITKFNGHTWPSHTPDMSSLDYWPWSVCLAELKRSHSAILE